MTQPLSFFNFPLFYTLAAAVVAAAAVIGVCAAASAAVVAAEKEQCEYYKPEELAVLKDIA